MANVAGAHRLRGGPRIAEVHRIRDRLTVHREAERLAYPGVAHLRHQVSGAVQNRQPEPAVGALADGKAPVARGCGLGRAHHGNVDLARNEGVQARAVVREFMDVDGRRIAKGRIEVVRVWHEVQHFAEYRARPVVAPRPGAHGIEVEILVVESGGTHHQPRRSAEVGEQPRIREVQVEPQGKGVQHLGRVHRRDGVDPGPLQFHQPIEVGLGDVRVEPLAVNEAHAPAQGQVDGVFVGPGPRSRESRKGLAQAVGVDAR